MAQTALQELKKDNKLPTEKAIKWVNKYIDRKLIKSHPDYEPIKKMMQDIFNYGWKRHEGK